MVEFVRELRVRGMCNRVRGVYNRIYDRVRERWESSWNVVCNLWQVRYLPKALCDEYMRDVCR